ncbi:valyl-tRNA synthetase [compost metagenome]|jgi:valyl-tRNA synthetase
MAKEAGKIAAEMEKIEKKLSNEKFVENAKEEVVQAERERLAELKDAAARVATAEARIREAG